MKQTLQYLAAFALLAAGGLIYLLYRPTTLLLFRIIDATGLASQVGLWRTAVQPCSLSDFTVYCLPNGLWAGAYVLAIDSACASRPAATRMTWAAVIPALGVISELLQTVGIVPGTPDWGDALCYVAPYLIYILYIRLTKTWVTPVSEDADQEKEELVEENKTLKKIIADKADSLINAMSKEDKENVKKNEPIERDPYEELDELIGLEDVKAEVHSLANFVKVQKQREQQGLKTPKLSYHLVFTGSPGTGKTTVARIIARIYKDLGILKKGHTVETDRSGLVAKYMGQTAQQTNHVVDSALNGVLFIDEAYSLVPEGNLSGDYGQEAIATLLKRMEDDRDRLVVIIAGYPKEMNRFIDSNPGLKSRFTRYINFPDYTSKELFEIFVKLYLKKNQYTITDDAAAYLRKSLDEAVAHKDKNFGNARYVRNVFEKAIQEQANRVSTLKNATARDLTEITIEDIQKAL